MKFILILLFLLLNSFSSLFSEINDKILIKVENNIITNYEFKNKILRLLMFSNTEVTQENINLIKKSALDSLLMSEIKKIELSKYPIKIDQKQLDSYISKISVSNINELKKRFNQNNIDYDLYAEEMETELMWQNLIYSKYSNKINIDENILNAEIKKVLDNQEKIKEFNLSEIEISLESLDENLIKKKTLEIKEKIINQGFEKVAMTHSVSLTSSNKGNLGWINSKSLSKEILDIVKEMDIGSISEPIIKQNNLIFLKLNEKKFTDPKAINKKILKERILNNKKNELFNLYSRSYLSKLKNNSLIEYK